MSRVDDLERELARLRFSLEEKDRVIVDLNARLVAMEKTTMWRIVRTARRLQARLPGAGRWRRGVWLAYRTVEVLVDEGPRAVVHRTRGLVHRALGARAAAPAPPSGSVDDIVDREYQTWLDRPGQEDRRDTPAALAQLRAQPLISVLVAIPTSGAAALRRTLESVRAQSYARWELCLGAGAGLDAATEHVLDEAAAGDPRVLVKRLPDAADVVASANGAFAAASGDLVGLLEPGDVLAPDALYHVAALLDVESETDVVYSDEDRLDADRLRHAPFFKPDWSPDLLLSTAYLGRFTAVRRRLLDETGGFRPGFHGHHEHDLLLRVTERARQVSHVARVLCHRGPAPAPAPGPEAATGGRRAVEEALARRGTVAAVEVVGAGAYHVRYPIAGSPLVSIIIATRDRLPLLRQCIRSIEERTAYRRYEILVVDNDSREPDALSYLEALARRWPVYRSPGTFNFAAINNLGVRHARGEHLLFLNNDTQVIAPDWLEAMIEHAQRPEVGAVGAKLLFPDGRIQHAGVVVGLGGIAGHAFKHHTGVRADRAGLPDVVRNCSAVTGACLMVSRARFDEVQGFDERLRVVFNDIDLCLRLRERGHLIVFTPRALLYHYESASRGRREPPDDLKLFRSRWGDALRRGDPYYNPNLTLAREDWSLRF